MIAFIGDVHRAFAECERIIDTLPSAVMAVIQVGDLQIWPLEGMPPGSRNLRPGRRVFFVDGNWDYFPWFEGISAPTELLPNVTYVPRGAILELDGRSVGFLGGAESISEYRRTRGVNWWPNEEGVHDADVVPFQGCKVDILVTHIPPASVLESMASNIPGFRLAEMPASALKTEAAWQLLGHPTVVSGHVHATYHEPGVHVLNGLELLLL